MFIFDVACFNCDMSYLINNGTVIVISSDDDFENDYFDLKRPRSKSRKRQRQQKESSVKKRLVNYEPKTEPVLPWKYEQQKQNIPSDDVLHQKSCETTLQLKAPDVLSRLWKRYSPLSSNPTLLWDSDKQLDIRCSGVASDHESNNKYVKRKTLKKGTVKPLLDIVPKEELPEPVLGKTTQNKSSPCAYHVKPLLDIVPKEGLPELVSGETTQNKSSPCAYQNSRKSQNHNDTKPLLVQSCDQIKRPKVEDYSRSWKADEEIAELDIFIDTLKFRQRQFNTLSNCEKPDDSVHSDKSRETNIESKQQQLKDDFTNQNDIQSREFFSGCDNFSFGDKFQSGDNFIGKNILPKQKLLLIDKSSDVSSGDELDIELPNLETTENQLPNEPLQILTFTKNVETFENFAKSSENIQCISLTPVPKSVPMETENLLTEVGCSMARDKCHLYLEFPPFLSEPSSNSWLKHCNGDCKATGSSDWTKVSEFSQFKVSLVKDLFDAFGVNTKSASSHKRSKQGPVCEEPLDEEVHFAGTSCRQVSLVFRNLTSFTSQPTVALTATLLKYLSYTRTLGDSHSLHRVLKEAACLHPHRSTLPFNSEMLFQVLETISGADKDQQHYSNLLSLDFMVSCLEMEFLVNFQSIGLRRMRKTKLFELFNSNFALRNIQTQLLVACQRFDPKDRDPIRILPLLQRLLCIAGGVVIAGVDGVAQVASMLIGEYDACKELSVRVAVLESISFPFHRFVMVRQLLERWRCKSMSRSLRSLMVSDVGALLNAYLTDRFFGTLVMTEMGWMSTEMAEELVMLLYTLVESYLHTKKDCLASSYWEKIGLNEKMENDLDLSSLSLMRGYVDILQSFLVYHLALKEKLSRKTCLYLVKLECLADLCIQQ